MAGKKAAEDVQVVAEHENVDGPVFSQELATVSIRERQDRVARATTLQELREIFGESVAWEEIEPGFTVIKKEVFGEDQPFVIGAFRFNESKKFMTKSNAGVLIPREFVSMLVAKFDPETEQLLPAVKGSDQIWVILNDGSTGIHAQLERYAEAYGNGDPRQCPTIRAEKGLRRSEYDYEDEDGSVSKASTWYLA